MNHVLALLPDTLTNERGMPGFGVCIWRDREDPLRPPNSESECHPCSVGEFLSRPENQVGTWLIDGGWGGPPGPVYVRWNGAQWENGGFHGRRFQGEVTP